MQRYEYATDCKWLTALKLNEIAADVRSSFRHVAREKSCSIAFLFPHSLLFCVHGMLAHQLVHPLALSRREERMTYSCFQRNRGRRLSGSVARATAARRLAAVRSAHNRPRVGKKADDGRSCSGQKRHTIPSLGEHGPSATRRASSGCPCAQLRAGTQGSRTAAGSR